MYSKRTAQLGKTCHIRVPDNLSVFKSWTQGRNVDPVKGALEDV